MSMMLESTFHAVHSSFHAVLGVAEHFTKMRLQVSQVLSALSAFRMIKYLYAKFLYLFGLASNNPAFADSVVSFTQADPGSKHIHKSVTRLAKLLDVQARDSFCQSRMLSSQCAGPS